jgi:hypothetical protein
MGNQVSLAKGRHPVTPAGGASAVPAGGGSSLPLPGGSGHHARRYYGRRGLPVQGISLDGYDPGLGQERAGNACLDRVPGSLAWS